MNKETAKCEACGNFNEILTATGFKKPENKGKKYFTCIGCNKFQWVNDNKEQEQEEEISKEPDREKIEEAKVDWEANHRTNMAMSALKGATQIISSLITAGNEEAKVNARLFTKGFASELYEWLDGKRKNHDIEELLNEAELPF